MATVRINGVRYEVEGDVNVIDTVGGIVHVNGRPVGSEIPASRLDVVVEGVITGDLRVVNGSVKCGDVGGNVDAGGSVSCGKISGCVDAGGSVTCGDGVEGDVDAGGSVTCAYVNGDIDATIVNIHGKRQK